MRLGIRTHINQFPRVESHYLREQTERGYIEEGLTIGKMYELYKSWCREKKLDPAKKWLYSNIFNFEFNLGFLKPKRDQCDVCERYSNAFDAEKEELHQEIKR